MIVFLRGGPGRCVRRVFLALAALVAAPGGAWAQGLGTVTGRVFSGAAPVAGAKVEVEALRVRAVTGKDGKYTLRLPAGTHLISVSREGYRGQRVVVVVEAGKEVVADFRLELAVVPVAEVLVGTRGPGRRVAESAARVEVITAGEIEASGAVETSRILERRLPSFHAMSPSAGAAVPTRLAAFRGHWPDQAAVLVEGRPWHAAALPYADGAAGVDLDAIPSSAIQRIEVLHGDASVLHGAGVGGAVHVVLDDAPGGRLVSRAGRTADGADVVLGAARYGLHAGERGRIAGALELRDRGAAPGVEAATQDVAALVHGTLEVLPGVEVAGLANYGVRRTQSDAAAGTPATAPGLAVDSRDVAGLLRVRGTWGGWRWELAAEYGANHFVFEATPALEASGEGAATPATGALRGATMQVASSGPAARLASIAALAEAGPGRLRSSRAAVALDVGGTVGGVPGGPLEVAAGLEFRRELWAADSAGVLVSGVARLGGAAWGSAEARPGEVWRVAVAGRVDGGEGGRSVASGTLATRYEPVPGVALRGGFGAGFRAPSPVQLSHAAAGPRALDAERAVAYGLGMVLTAVPDLLVTLDVHGLAVAGRVAEAGAGLVNALDTEARGLDVTAAYGVRAGGGVVRVRGAFSTATMATDLAHETAALDAGPAAEDVRSAWLDAGPPRGGAALGARYTRGPLDIAVHGRRYGTVVWPEAGEPGAGGTEIGGRWVADGSVAYVYRGRLELAAGALNAFDAYADVASALPFHPGRATWYVRIATTF